MSSGTPTDPYASTQIVQGLSGEDVAGTTASQLSKRQALLNRFYSYYHCENYASRMVDWNGAKAYDQVEHEVVATQASIPDGFVDSGGATLPLKFRRPSSPYYLAKVIVDRFTGLLFSAKRHPSIVVPGDQDTEDFLLAVADAGRLWSQMYQARSFGGACGSVAVSFEVLDGNPQFEVHDPRWSFPVFENKFTHTLSSFEKRYTYTEEVRDENGKWVEKKYWYRRVIDKVSDTIWLKVPVLDRNTKDNGEPDWSKFVTTQVNHNLGVCPVVWIQNTPNDSGLDGEPDCFGIYELIESYDALISQAQRGTLANSDPSLWIATDDDLQDNWIAKGSNAAIKTSANGKVQYLEITGSGPNAAMSLAKELRERACEVAAYIPEVTNQNSVMMTATEINTRVSRMLERADVFREQYGERGIKKLLELVIHVCRRLDQPLAEVVVAEDGSESVGVYKYKINLPPRYVDGVAVERKLGQSSNVELRWPRYIEPSLGDISAAAQATQIALTAGAIDRQVAVDFLKGYFPIRDSAEVVARIIKEAEDREAQQLARSRIIHDKVDPAPTPLEENGIEDNNQRQDTMVKP